MSTALLIIDIQNDYFEKGNMPLVGAKEASENARLVLNQFRTDHLPVIHIQHIASRPTATFFLPNTTGASIHENVIPHEGEKVIIKHFPNSFRETELFDYLMKTQISDLVVCGMMTHMCVDSTVRAAKDYGFNIVLIGDACATRDLSSKKSTVKAEMVHAGFLSALAYFYATVLTADAFLAGKRE